MRRYYCCFATNSAISHNNNRYIKFLSYPRVRLFRSSLATSTRRAPFTHDAIIYRVNTSFRSQPPPPRIRSTITIASANGAITKTKTTLPPGTDSDNATAAVDTAVSDRTRRPKVFLVVYSFYAAAAGHDRYWTLTPYPRPVTCTQLYQVTMSKNHLISHTIRNTKLNFTMLLCVYQTKSTESGTTSS